MSRIEAVVQLAYIGALEGAVARIDDVAESAPRLFMTQDHLSAVDVATSALTDAVRAGTDSFTGTPYEPAAQLARQDALRAVEEMGRPTQSNLAELAARMRDTISVVGDQLATARQATLGDRVAAGEVDQAKQHIVDSIDTFMESASVDRASALVLRDAATSASWQIPKPHLPVSRSLGELLDRADGDPRAAHDLRRVLAVWRSTIVDDFVPGPELAERTAAIVARGADEMTPAHWLELQRLADADPAGAYVRVPRAIPGTRQSFDDLAFEAGGRTSTGFGTWEEHVLVESTSLAMARVDADLANLRREVRALLRQDPTRFGDRQWARLAELARLDAHHRVLPDARSQSAREAIADVFGERVRDRHPESLTPSGRRWDDTDAVALAQHWKRHVFGLDSRIRLLMADDGVDTLLRGIGKVEAGLGEAIEAGIPESATPREILRTLAGRVGLSIGRGIRQGVRDGVEALTAKPVTGDQLASALVGGAIPPRLSIGDLRRLPEWQQAPHIAQVSLLTRMAARHVPTTMAASRRFIADVQRVPIDESLLSPKARQKWREALALAQLEARSMRGLGEHRDGYAGHVDYASVGRLKSILELVGAELALRAKVEMARRLPVAPPAAAAAAPTMAARPVAASPSSTTAAAPVARDASSALPEILVW